MDTPGKEERLEDRRFGSAVNFPRRARAVGRAPRPHPVLERWPPSRPTRPTRVDGADQSGQRQAAAAPRGGEDRAHRSRRRSSSPSSNTLDLDVASRSPTSGRPSASAPRRRLRPESHGRRRARRRRETPTTRGFQATGHEVPELRLRHRGSDASSARQYNLSFGGSEVRLPDEDDDRGLRRDQPDVLERL